jgi:hypothetical protein
MSLTSRQISPILAITFGSLPFPLGFPLVAGRRTFPQHLATCCFQTTVAKVSELDPTCVWLYSRLSFFSWHVIKLKTEDAQRRECLTWEFASAAFIQIWQNSSDRPIYSWVMYIVAYNSCSLKLNDVTRRPRHRKRFAASAIPPPANSKFVM